MAHTAASDDSLILNVSESSYEAEGSESDNHDIVVDDIGYMLYRFEPYASESDETNSESDSGDGNPPDDLIHNLVSLVNSPQPEHPLRADLAEEYNKDRAKFMKNAEEFTKKHSEKRPVD
ncbi:hypothetical protein NQZ68_010130 [Dissostichus eleginoides]|nr:hypothetical protein NQZ68_010130 [Dissostichus eleginoides]